MSRWRLDPPIEINVGGNPEWTVIWLHGLGADGHDFSGLIPGLNLAGALAGAGIRFVFPHAPVRPVTINGGYPMRAWYDVLPAPEGFRANLPDLDETCALVQTWLDHEQSLGIAPDHVLLGGFSQGGSVALSAGLRARDALLGIVSLSAPVPDVERLVREAARRSTTPVFMAHGRQDPVVPFGSGDAARLALAAAGLPLEWREYPIVHTVSEGEMDDLARWIQRLLAHGGMSEAR